jgi:hypothetical protein
MKLRNKKTGEIRTAFVQVVLENNHPAKPLEFNTQLSIAELNEEWEDFEEPKDYWTIERNEKGGLFVHKVAEMSMLPDWIKTDEEYGIKFATEEEAEKAVEKLKAWTRLKDKGFKFRGCHLENKHFRDLICCDTDEYIKVGSEECKRIQEDYDFLFGGEE